MTKKKITAFCILSALLVQFVFPGAAAGPPTATQEEEKSNFFKDLLADDWAILSSPTRIKAKHLLTWGSAALITAVLVKNDETLFSRAKRFQEKHKWIDDWSPQITKLGDGTINLGVAGVFYLCGVILKDKKAKKTGELGIMSLIHAGVVVQLLKHLTGRKRPEAAPYGEDHWEGPAGFFKRYKNHSDMYYDSFFSGHTITAWSIAAVVAKMYNKSFIVPAICYSLAAAAGLSRVAENKHWFSDVFVGAVVGYAIGNFLVNKRWRRVAVLPLIQQDKIGLSFNYIFTP